MKKPRFRIADIKTRMITLAVALGGLLLYYFLDMRCPVRSLLHIPCPGCGMSSAYRALLHFDIAGAFSHHFMFWSVPILFMFFLFDPPIFSKKIDGAILIILGSGFFINWIIGVFSAFLA